jgi:hypothetical protein
LFILDSPKKADCKNWEVCYGKKESRRKGLFFVTETCFAVVKNLLTLLYLVFHYCSKFRYKKKCFA